MLRTGSVEGTSSLLFLLTRIREIGTYIKYESRFIRCGFNVRFTRPDGRVIPWTPSLLNAEGLLKACKDCKHISPAGEFSERRECLRSSYETVDYLDGSKTKKHYSCQNEREALDAASCGPTAQFFKPVQEVS